MLDESECANFLHGKVVVGTLILGNSALPLEPMAGNPTPSVRSQYARADFEP